MENYAFRLSRISLFVIYFWFGSLKVLGLSPANPLVAELLNRTLPSLNFNQFIIWFGLFEMLIGVLFLFPRLIKIAAVVLIAHMLTTFLPLVFLPEMTWHGFLTPTLEGQYIIKNLVILSLVATILTRAKK